MKSSESDDEEEEYDNTIVNRWEYKLLQWCFFNKQWDDKFAKTK